MKNVTSQLRALLLLLALLSFGLPAASASQNQSLAGSEPANAIVSSCSGDDCGCDGPFSECLADCGPPGTPGRIQCMTACVRANKACAIACCSP